MDGLIAWELPGSNLLRTHIESQSRLKQLRLDCSAHHTCLDYSDLQTQLHTDIIESIIGASDQRATVYLDPQPPRKGRLRQTTIRLKPFTLTRLSLISQNLTKHSSTLRLRPRLHQYPRQTRLRQA
ncbi:hypothetical protein BFJ63_vAg771 [Fusarium oxysporum f. sp. narcissi]|uniref:Uncharacterized protein n=1 Tax=Fusarium oxysporum f. sp. narcissi TaxID=451672 RepID=A0A4Q2WD92_FUSOX|nr:hypothetical protein BFJ63_vAg771 [Fusarium oxysporum f. sp. narcissi]